MCPVSVAVLVLVVVSHTLMVESLEPEYRVVSRQASARTESVCPVSVAVSVWVVVSQEREYKVVSDVFEYCSAQTPLVCPVKLSA